MNYSTNLSLYTLLNNSNIIIYNDLGTEIIKIRIPSVLELNENMKLKKGSHFISKDLEELKQMTPDFVIKNKRDVCLLLFQKNLATDVLFPFFSFILPGFNFKENALFVNETEITEELYELIIEVMMFGLGKKDYGKEEEQDEELDEFEKRMREYEQKIQDIKNSSETDKSTILLIQDLFGVILTELPNYNIASLLQMNEFGLFWHYKIALKAANNKIGLASMQYDAQKYFKF